MDRGLAKRLAVISSVEKSEDKNYWSGGQVGGWRFGGWSLKRARGRGPSQGAGRRGVPAHLGEAAPVAPFSRCYEVARIRSPAGVRRLR
jgi:hypothetical protein